MLGCFLALVFASTGFQPSQAWGDELYSVAQASDEDAESKKAGKDSERDVKSETTDLSKGAQKKLTGFMGSITDTWDRVSNWVLEKVNLFKSKVDSVFGFEKGEGAQAFFGTVLYFVIFLVAFFILMFVYNVIKDMFSGISSKKKYKKRK